MCRNVLHKNEENISFHAGSHYLEETSTSVAGQHVPGGSSLEQLNCIVANIPLDGNNGS